MEQGAMVPIHLLVKQYDHFCPGKFYHFAKLRIFVMLLSLVNSGHPATERQGSLQEQRPSYYPQGGRSYGRPMGTADWICRRTRA